MKNKHLVFLFLTVMALGLLARFSPVPYRSFFRKHLLRYDPVAVSRLVLSVPEQPDMALTRTENRWIAEQGGRTAVAPAPLVADLLKALSALDTFEHVKTSRPDTFGFEAGYRIGVRFFEGNKLLEDVQLGREERIQGKDYSYVLLPAHEGVYRVPGQLRKVYLRTLLDFRPKTVAEFEPASIKKVFFQTESREPFLYERNDSTERWYCCHGLDSMADDSMQAWLNLFSRLEGSPFADFFDESREDEAQYSRISLEPRHGPAVTLRFFRLSPADLPEDLGLLRELNVRTLPAYVLHSSQNPYNYFSLSDTNLLRFIHTALAPENE